MKSEYCLNHNNCSHRQYQHIVAVLHVLRIFCNDVCMQGYAVDDHGCDQCRCKGEVSFPPPPPAAVCSDVMCLM